MKLYVFIFVFLGFFSASFGQNDLKITEIKVPYNKYGSIVNKHLKYVEIENPTSEPIALYDYYLTTKKGDAQKLYLDRAQKKYFPSTIDKQLIKPFGKGSDYHKVLRPGELTVIKVSTITYAFHLSREPFKLLSDKGTVYLYKKPIGGQAFLVDSLSWEPVSGGYSNSYSFESDSITLSKRSPGLSNDLIDNFKLISVNNRGLIFDYMYSNPTKRNLEGIVYPSFAYSIGYMKKHNKRFLFTRFGYGVQAIKYRFSVQKQTTTFKGTLFENSSGVHKQQKFFLYKSWGFHLNEKIDLSLSGLLNFDFGYQETFTQTLEFHPNDGSAPIIQDNGTQYFDDYGGEAVFGFSVDFDYNFGQIGGLMIRFQNEMSKKYTTFKSLTAGLYLMLVKGHKRNLRLHVLKQ